MADIGLPRLTAPPVARLREECQAGAEGARPGGEPAGSLRLRWKMTAFVIALLCVSLSPGLYRGWVTWRHVGASPVASMGTLVVRDFGQFWGGAHLVWTGHALSAFHPGRFQAWLRHFFAPATDVDPWSYPPSFLLLVTPLGAFGLLPAYAIWLVATLAMLVFALRGQEFGPWFIAAVLASPATLSVILAGQNGALTAALLVGGFGLLDRRPVLAGVLFGLLTIKPQLGLLVPVALIAGRNYRAIGGAIVTSLALALASGLAFGAQSWVLFFTRTRPYMDHVLTLPAHGLMYQLMMPTAFMTARNVGMGLISAGALQAAFGVLAALWMWRVWRRPCGDRQVRVALSLVLVFLATPYGFSYDMIPVAIGAAMLVTRGLQTRTLPGETIAFVAWTLPGIIVVLNVLNVGLLAPAALLGLAACLQRRLSVVGPASA